MRSTRYTLYSLIFFVAVFCLLCGWLVVESGLFCTDSRTKKPACILLQHTETTETNDKSSTQKPPATRKIQLKAAPTFGADDAKAQVVTLGSIDPKSGFKYQLELTTKGAAIRKATFSEFDDRDYKNPQPLVILSPVLQADGSETLSMANTNFVFVQQQLQLPLDKLHWKRLETDKTSDGSQTACFEAVIKNEDTDEPVARLVKSYKLLPESYMVHCDITIENLSASEQKIRFNLYGPAGIGREGFRSDMRKVVGGFQSPDGTVISTRKNILTSFFGRFKNKSGLKDATEDYYQARNKQQKEQAERNLRISHQQSGAHFLWAATTNKYFAAILRPVPKNKSNFCDWIEDKRGWYYNPDNDESGDSGDETIGLDLKIAPATLTPKTQAGSARTYNFQLYIGPKDKSLFDKNKLYQELGFVQTIDFLGCCCPASIIKPLAFGILALMKWMHGFIPNYGVVIFILVFLVRIILHPLAKKSQVSMSKMSKLAPRAEQIKKKYANNKAEMNKQMMALYKEQGASPVFGFLPMMIQMPIWISLWSAIYASIDLRGAAFLPFWITDLSIPDALIRFQTITIPLLGWKVESLNLLPILMGVAMYLQQQLMPKQPSASPQAAQQQKMMMIMMPLFFPLILYKAPSGVNLYIMASTFAGVIEQHIIRKHIREKEEAEEKGLVAATSKTGGKVKKKKPKPFYKNF